VSRPLRVMILEDNAVYALYLRRVVETMRYTPHVYDTNDRALYALVTGRFDLIILDNHIGDKRAVEIVTAIRRDERHDAVPLLILTSGVTQADRELLTKLGVSHIASKEDRAGIRGHIEVAIGAASPWRRNVDKAKGR
jgi:two-component system chemotaxis sensor kinase CheA